MLNRIGNIILVCFLVLLFAGRIFAHEAGITDIPPRYGMGILSGNTFDPVSDIHYVQVSLFGVWDYDKVWHHWAPENLRFKVELNAGATVTEEVRTVASAEMSALYYWKSLATPRVSPYLIGCFGIIYTNFRVRDPEPPYEEMGLRFNFNPMIGIGTEISARQGGNYFTEVRLSHISNAGLDDQNRGLNSVVFLFGRFF
jgi:hypothetical protein